ncbi:hypothetical protein HHI36_019251 [Cryptolaemus montrouzieri]|uniref:Lipase n=1 Tax=Cryptolaemus montrouzieri TaxID=559131 RepID=A0ABD2P2G5_9CUCU
MKMKADYKFFVMICLGVSSLVGQGIYNEHRDVYLSTEEMIQSYGYPVEIHEIITEDGYILNMYRIPHGKVGSKVNQKPILLMHGVYGQGENYIVNGINNGSLAYLLADNGFDVWLGNSRGTQHGRKHISLNPTSKEFWDFSFHEIGMYDLPAKIDYILESTKKEKLHYVGHSQGGTVFYVMASMRPEYQQKVTLASLLAPGGYEKHFTNSFLLPFTVRHRELTKLADVANIYELPPYTMKLFQMVSTACSTAVFREICVFAYHMVSGGDSGELNEQILPLVFKYLPTVSTKQLLHYAQTIASGHMRPWDYGTKKNMELYGQPVPSDYPVENISVPMAMYYSLGDNLAFAKDIEDICDTMQNCVRKFLMPNEKWTHMDFLASKNLAHELNEPLLEFIQDFENAANLDGF